MLVDLLGTTLLLALLAVARSEAADRDDVTTTRFHGDESSDVTVSSSTPSPYVNPRPGKINKTTTAITVG